MPRFKTRRGIEYHGQLLPKLDQNAPMEYTLQCIPAMRQFHDLEDNEYRESIVATAVILRQLEEIDDEEEDDDDERDGLGHGQGAGSRSTQINFLPIIDAILRSRPSRHLFAQRGVTQAAYWMALRQEIYHSFTRREPPQMFLEAEYWAGASRANKSVMHSVQVAKWCWGDRSQHEWGKHMHTSCLSPNFAFKSGGLPGTVGGMGENRSAHGSAAASGRGSPGRLPADPQETTGQGQGRDLPDGVVRLNNRGDEQSASHHLKISLDGRESSAPVRNQKKDTQLSQQTATTTHPRWTC